MTGSTRSRFGWFTADKLWSVYQRMPKAGPVNTFTALSAATGAGKTTSAAALMVHLAVTEGAASAYVAPSIAVAEEVLQHLLKLTAGTDVTVAAYSTIHRERATDKDLRNYAEAGTRPSRQYAEDAVKSAQLIVVTHHRWSREAETGLDLGVLKCAGTDRAVVFVDEEPSLDLTLNRQPEDISALVTLLAPKDTTDSHKLADVAALRNIHDRMRTIVDAPGGAFLQESDIVTQDDLLALALLEKQQVTDAAARLGYGEREATLKGALETLEFLRLAAQGRVFFDRRTGFHAYGAPVKPLPRHIILDGTADLNGMYAIGKHVTVVNALQADYRNLGLFTVRSPKGIGGRFNANGVLKNSDTVQRYLGWFMPFLESQTKPGEQVLVYCKKDMLRYSIHRSPEFDDNDAELKGRAQDHLGRERLLTTYKGRLIHWSTFGHGRGLNLWKDCTAYFRLGDFMLTTGATVARIGATTGEQFTAADLRYLNAAGIKDARMWAVQSAFAAVSNKQDSMRTSPRCLDDDGVAAPGRLYMVDCDLGILETYRERMFPGAPAYVHLGDQADAEISHSQRVSSGSDDFPPKRSPMDGAAARVAETPHIQGVSSG
ncbi:MAG: hypothetical protein GJU76_07055, partial [Gallionella sp.]|nr:hypothetical protein [Gallionella sp.]